MVARVLETWITVSRCMRALEAISLMAVDALRGARVDVVAVGPDADKDDEDDNDDDDNDDDDDDEGDVNSDGERG